MRLRGKLIVIEGVDAAGKATQTKLLMEKLKTENIPVETFTFPDYNSISGVIIKEHLDGKYGDPTKMGPYLMGGLYAADRAKYAQTIIDLLANGTNVILDRYTTSNIGFQACKIDNENEKGRYIANNYLLEHNTNRLPTPDVIFFLDVPPTKSIMLSRQRGKQDLNEVNINYLMKAYNTYKRAAKENRYGTWHTVRCMDALGNMLCPSHISRSIYVAIVNHGLVYKHTTPTQQGDYSPLISDESLMYITKGIDPVRRKVVCAAVQFDTPEGRHIVCSPRHHDATMNAQLKHYNGVTNEVQGFLDQYGQFLTREAAMVIANANGQAINYKCNGSNTKLYSGGLY